MDMDIEFPALPAYEAAWAPIVWTPTLGSEEKLLIGLVGKFNNHFFAKRVVPDSTLGILYKSKKKNAIDILDGHDYPPSQLAKGRKDRGC